MNAFCSLEDGLEELEELEENDVIGCYHELFFLPVSFQSPSSHWKTLEGDWKNEVPPEFRAARQKGSFRAP